MATSDDVYKALKPEDSISNIGSVMVVDFWRCLPESIRDHPKIRYVPLVRCIHGATAISKIDGL